MTSAYAIMHFWPARGGFAKRMEMLCQALRQRADVLQILTLRALMRMLRSRAFNRQELAIVIYTSLLAPLAAAIRLVRPGIDVYYMVRGDEVSYTLHAGRRLRAMAAVAFQKLLAATGCHFVFASADLEQAFRRRLGKIRRCSVLPNTLGAPLPPIRPFDGSLAVVGDFDSVKNIEHSLKALADGEFRVDLYGNSRLPDQYRRPWLTAHGHVDNLPAALRRSSLVVFSSVSEGFPNVMVEALQAGCGVAAHTAFPFERLPLNRHWRFELDESGQGLRTTLERLRGRPGDFKADNPHLVKLVESDWRRRVWEVFGAQVRRDS